MPLKIIPIETFESKTKEEIVNDLENLLERAKNGEFEGFAWVASLKNGFCKTAFTRSVNFHTLLSGVVMLQHRMISLRQNDEWEDNESA